MKMKKYLRLIAFAVVAAVLFGCVIDILDIVFTENPQANAEDSITVKVEFRNGTDCNNTYLVFAALFPSNMNIRENAKVTYTSQNFDKHQLPDVVDAEMIPMELDALELKSSVPWASALMTKFGTMGNYGDFEWVVWRTKDICNLFSSSDDSQENRSQADIKITFKNEARNVKFHFATTYATTTLGLDDANGGYYCKPVSKTYQTSGGAGTEDYTVPKLVTITPLKFTFEDIMGVDFMSAVTGVETELINENDVHLMGKVVLDDGTEILINEVSADNRMTRASEYQYKKYIYPRQFFNVPKDRSISNMYLWFVSADGTKAAGSEEAPYEQYETGTPLK